MANPIKKFVGAVKEYNAAKNNIKKLQPQIQAKKAANKVKQGKKVTVAESRRINYEDLEFDNGAKRRPNPDSTKVR